MKSEHMMLNQQLQESNYVTLVITVPESHADYMREVIAQAGAGQTEHYSHGTFSSKGIGRYKPKRGAMPFIGQEGVIQEVPEERIETICAKACLIQVIEAIKQAHPYEETVIDIYPIYEMCYKRIE